MAITGNKSNIGREFLSSLDDFLKENYQTLKCSDIHMIYSQFFDELKVFKGNSTGFTGLSEYLILRLLLHVSGGAFSPVQVTRFGLSVFESQSDKSFRIGQGVPVKANGKKLYPDIVVYRNDEPRAVAQVKIYLTNGVEEVEKEVQIFNDLKKKYPWLRALLIIFNKLSESNRAKVLPALKTYIGKEARWLNFLILEGNQEPIGNKLRAYLGI